MKDRDASKVTVKAATKVVGLHGRSHDAAGLIQQGRGDKQTLGLRAFEKISAVEGIRLSGEMRRDLKDLDARHMDEDQRSAFITGKYGKT